MKKSLNGWQVALSIACISVVYFTVTFGAGHLLSKAAWVAKLDIVGIIAGWLWIVLYSAHIILSLKRVVKKYPGCKNISLLFRLLAFACLTIELTISMAFTFAGII